MMIKSLSDTSTFKYSELMGEDKISNIIKKVVDAKYGATYVTEDQLEDVFYKMRHKSFNFSAKFAVIELFKKGIIKLLYNNKIKLTVAVPFFTYKMPEGGFGVIVNISNFAKLKSDGSYYIDPLILYSLMLSATFSLSLNTYTNLCASSGLPELYGALFTNVVARIVNVDQVNKDKIKFISTKFMYIQLGVNEQRASISAEKELKYLDKVAIEQLDLAIPASAYTEAQAMIEAIKIAFPEFTGFEFSVVFDRWMRSYGESTAFAIEYIPYFVASFIALVANCNSLINVKAIEREANRNNKKLINLFNRIENIVIEMSQR